MKRFSLALITLIAALAACADSTCKDGCDKARTCNLSTSGLSCSSGTTGCVAMDNGCANCLTGKTCDEIRGGACASACPGYRP